MADSGDDGVMTFHTNVLAVSSLTHLIAITIDTLQLTRLNSVGTNTNTSNPSVYDTMHSIQFVASLVGLSNLSLLADSFNCLATRKPSTRPRSRQKLITLRPCFNLTIKSGHTIEKRNCMSDME